MKKICSILLIAVFLFATVGCSCGLSCCGSSQVPKTPENPTFVLAYDDASIKTLLAYYQANTGYQPSFTDVTEKTEAAYDPATLATPACIAVLKDETVIANLEAANWTRVSLDNPFGLTVLEPPSGSSAVRNENATSALKVWLGGAEAKYLSEHADLWQ